MEASLIKIAVVSTPPPGQILTHSVGTDRIVVATVTKLIIIFIKHRKGPTSRLKIPEQRFDFLLKVAIV